jgi:hypothetical protein
MGYAICYGPRMNGPAYIEIERQSNPWRDRLRSYRLIMDGVQMGTLSRGSSLRYEVAPGQHHICLRVDWCRSRVLKFDVQPGETVSFICAASAGSWRALYDASLGWRRYISLNRVERITPNLTSAPSATAKKAPAPRP